MPSQQQQQQQAVAAAAAAAAAATGTPQRVMQVMPQGYQLTPQGMVAARPVAAPSVAAYPSDSQRVRCRMHSLPMSLHFPLTLRRFFFFFLVGCRM